MDNVRIKGEYWSLLFIKSVLWPGAGFTKHFVPY